MVHGRNCQQPWSIGCAGKVVPFVGAGVSLNVRRKASNDRAFPSWEELLRGAEARLRSERKYTHAKLVDGLLEAGRPDDYLEAARRTVDGLGPIWYEFLREQFDHPRDQIEDESLEVARLIWSLGSWVVVTTNYDKVLHWACPRRDDLAVWDIESPAEQVSLLKGEIDRPVVWHLHGHVGNLTRIILTPDGYTRLYMHDVRSDDPYAAALNTLRYQLSSHSFLFIGFSFDDAHVSSQLRQMEGIFEGATGPHYVMLHRSRADTLGRMTQPRVEPIFFEEYGDPLVEKLRELAAIAGHRESTATVPDSIERSTTPASTAVAVTIPPFHYGSVVPLDFFIDREAELEGAKRFIMTRQSFLIVGRRRAGKTSFGQKLIHSLMAENAARQSRVLGTYLDLQQYSDLDVDRFLSHTLLNLIGEVARQVFCCKYTTLSRKNPFDIHPELKQDIAFTDLLELYSEVVARTHTRPKSASSHLRPDEFERFIADLLEICRHKGWADVFIFYDEANRLPLDLSVEFLTWNVEALNRAGIVSIYSASPEMAKKFNPWSDREIRIGPFLKVEDMLRLLTRYYFGEISSRDDLPIAREAIVRIWELSHGIPYLIQHISGQSFSLANVEGARRVEERHVRHAHEDLSGRRTEMFRE